MASIDLRQFVSKRGGPWSKTEDVSAFSASLLKLSRPEDSVTLNGPLSVRITINVRNQFMFGGQHGDDQSQAIASYRLDIPPAQSWSYDYPASKESLLVAVGSNANFEVKIEPSVGGIDYYDQLGVDPYHSYSPCDCHKSPCACKPPASSDLPCDFAVGSHRNLGEFFPSACEPCTPGSFVRMPPLAGPRLSVPPASGGCTRTNYFNGMFITKEDLLTDQRNMRIKQQLQNRAMGQGVVWGLGVGLNGSSVVVQPGYAVDCCGNDITITSPYQVDYQALVNDPTAAAELSRGGPRRMHLLLEYFECPEDPRPVHGDACSPETTHCEMGRIRETARLRLVPPRDLNKSGPIQDFLNSIEIAGNNGDKPAPSNTDVKPADTHEITSSSWHAGSLTLQYESILPERSEWNCASSNSASPGIIASSPNRLPA